MDLTQFSRNFPATQTLGRKRQKSLNTSMNTLHLSTVEIEGSYPLASPMTEMATHFNGLNFAIPQVQNNWNRPFVQIPTRTHSIQSVNSMESMNTLQSMDMNIQANLELFDANIELPNGPSPLQPLMGVQMDTDLVSEDIKSVCNTPSLDYFRLDLDHTNKFIKTDFDMNSSSTEELAKRQSYDSLPDFYANYHDFSDFHKRSSNLDLNAEYAKMRTSDSFEHLRVKSRDSLEHASFGVRTSSLDTINVEPDFSMFMDPKEDARMVMNDIQKRLSDQRQRSVSTSSMQDQAKRERRIRRMSDQANEPQKVILETSNGEPPMPDEEEGDDAKPRKQTLKFENDMYTPHWVRYQGSKKEGYCDLCKPGRWLQLKTSAYWYHKQFTHGVSSITGRPFQDPIQVRTVWETCPTDNGEISVYLMTEGQCHQCNEYHPLYRNKKRFTQNFRSTREAKEFLLSPAIAQTQPAVVLSQNPLKILVAKTEEGELAVPSGMNVSQSTIKDMKSHENGVMSGVWWKHAHKCHVNE